MTGLTIVFSMIDKDNQLYPEQEKCFSYSPYYLKVGKVDLENETSTVQAVRQNLKFEKCNKTVHFGEYLSYFEKIPGLENYFCIPTNEYNLMIYGRHGDTRVFLF
jgi:hypothetical protein